MSRAYYNENNKAAAHVLRELIAANVIAPGDVDERSIVDVQPGDLAGYTQRHFFAGGGLWSVAARLAGWPDERPLWTGSCPCQPFSAAGKGLGADDPRHLWPHLFRLVRDASAAGHGPPVLMGEQVSGKAGQNWFDGVSADLASIGFASRTRDIPACAVDAPHQRNRLFWIALADGGDCRSRREPRDLRGEAGCDRASAPDGFFRDPRNGDGRLFGHAGSAGWPVGSTADVECGPVRDEGAAACTADAGGGLQPDADAERQRQLERAVSVQRGRSSYDHARNGSFWSDYEWIVSPVDGKARRAKPGIPFLVNGFPGRVDLWRIAGNAISPVLAAEVIAAFLETEGGLT